MCPGNLQPACHRFAATFCLIGCCNSFFLRLQLQLVRVVDLDFGKIFNRSWIPLMDIENEATDFKGLCHASQSIISNITN